VSHTFIPIIPNDTLPNYSKDTFQELIKSNDLIKCWQNQKDPIFTIAETNFEAGLNFLLSWQLWQQHAKPGSQLRYIASSVHPIKLPDLKVMLSAWPEVAKQAEELIEHYPVLTPGYHHLNFNKGQVQLTLMLGDVETSYEQLLICAEPHLELSLRSRAIDAWYLKGDESDNLLKIIAMLSQPENQKLERIRQRHTPWHTTKQVNNSNKSAIVIGAGLAGCFTAHFLAKKGWQVQIIDELPTIASAASGNQHAVIFPKLSAYRSPLTQFMLSSFLFASQTYRDLFKQHNLGELSGCLILPHNNKEIQAQNSLRDWLVNYPELGRLVSAEEASSLAGITIKESGLFIPRSGYLNTPELCSILIADERITVLNSKCIKELIYTGSHWQVASFESETVIIATGNKLTEFSQTNHLPVKAIRGQITHTAATNESELLQVPICGEGHVLPVRFGVHALGATYSITDVHEHVCAKDDAINLAKRHKLPLETNWSDTVLGHWAGIRASAPDYLPLVGPAPNAEEFNKVFHKLNSNSKRWLPTAGPCHPGLYICAGFGSRGLSTIPLCAQWLAGFINNELNCLPRSQIQALSPARFLRKEIIRGLSST
jgi:tRNA 5-methylaminomethyl-2-thiouridine biosynthesis bifunctional protein